MGTSSNRFTNMKVFSREGLKGRARNREALAQVKPSRLGAGRVVIIKQTSEYSIKQGKTFMYILHPIK
jgi:hypothetical protein